MDWEFEEFEEQGAGEGNTPTRKKHRFPVNY
jgi:hypothetical protein